MPGSEPSTGMVPTAISHLNKGHCHRRFPEPISRDLDSSTRLMLSSVAFASPKTSTLETHPKFMCTFHLHCFPLSSGHPSFLFQSLPLDNTLSTRQPERSSWLSSPLPKMVVPRKKLTHFRAVYGLMPRLLSLPGLSPLSSWAGHQLGPQIHTSYYRCRHFALALAIRNPRAL